MRRKYKRDKEKNIKFQNTVRKLFLYYAYIPACITLIVVSLLYCIIINMNHWNNTKEAAQITANRVEELYQDYSVFLHNFDGEDKGLIQNFQKQIKNNELYEKIYQFLGTQNVRAQIFLFNDVGEALLELDVPDERIQKHLTNSVIPKFHRTQKDFLTETGRISIGGDWETHYIMGQQITSEVGRAYLFAVIPLDRMKKIFTSNYSVSEVIVDDFDYILGRSNENIEQNVLGKFYLQTISSNQCIINGVRNFYVHHNIENANLNIYTMKNIGVTLKDMMNLIYFLVMISIVLFIGLQTYSRKLSFRVTEPVDKLMIAVSELQKGNFKTRVSIESKDEFGILAGQYNIMTEQIEKLLEENKELVLVQKSIEIQNLKTQFNPHFLFNILETIRYAILVDSRKAIEMVMDLSRLLRYSVNRLDKPAILVDDFEYIENYLNLQKNRFGDRLSYEIYVDKEADYARIPQLLIQPLVENSIKYGMRNQMNVKVNIVCRVIDGEVLIDVEDNGGGMEAGAFQQLMERLNGTQNVKGNIGLYNTHWMLRLMYGDKYGLEFRNEEGNAFYIRVRLPLIETDEG